MMMKSWYQLGSSDVSLFLSHITLTYKPTMWGTIFRFRMEIINIRIHIVLFYLYLKRKEYSKDLIFMAQISLLVIK